MTECRIFLSAASKELGSYRDELARILRTRGCIVKVQEEFQTSSGTLLEKLHAYIQSCHVVICLMGERYGAEPPSVEATRFAFSFGNAPAGATPRHSYTQWEYLFEAVAEQPSIQDLLITPITGSILGEVIHGATLSMKQNGTSFIEKAVILVINPMSVVFGDGFN